MGRLRGVDMGDNTFNVSITVLTVLLNMFNTMFLLLVNGHVLAYIFLDILVIQMRSLKQEILMPH